jgi:excisionase family DNA binding protein
MSIDVLTVGELASCLKFTERTIYRLVVDGKTAAFKV